MSIFQAFRNGKKESIIDIQSKVVEYQILPQKQILPQSELLNKLIDTKFPELLSKNIMKPKKKCLRKEINSFYSAIKHIRKKYNIEKSRKNNIDSLIKKVKSKFLNGLYEGLKYCLNSYINRLPQEFIINTQIDYNKKYLNKTIEEIYTEFKLLPTLDVIIANNMVKKDKKDLLYLLMKTKLKEIYKLYINSDLYLYEKKSIEKKGGEGAVQLYDYVATHICDYFLLNKGNSRKNDFKVHKKSPKNISNNSSKKNNVINNNNLFVKFSILNKENNPVIYSK